VNLASGVAYVGGRTGESGRRRRARTDDGADRLRAVVGSAGENRSQNRDVTQEAWLPGADKTMGAERRDGFTRPPKFQNRLNKTMAHRSVQAAMCACVSKYGLSSHILSHVERK